MIPTQVSGIAHGTWVPAKAEDGLRPPIHHARFSDSIQVSWIPQGMWKSTLFFFFLPQRNHHRVKPVLVTLSREDDFRCLFSEVQISFLQGTSCHMLQNLLAFLGRLFFSGYLMLLPRIMGFKGPLGDLWCTQYWNSLYMCVGFSWNKAKFPHSRWCGAMLCISNQTF